VTIEGDLNNRLLDDLAERGALSTEWRGAFERAPRHLFLPDVVWRKRADGRLEPVRRDQDPDAWLTLAYRDRPVDTQVDDGHPAADGTGYEVTSSSSQPVVVAEMLAELAPEPGVRVLEVGTGTGWNAALLAHRVGAENVVTVEIDPDVAAHARAALDRAGLAKVTVVTGDGEQGWPDGAPYDRVIATVGASVVPYAWVAQTRPGGRLVVPLNNTFQPPGLAVLRIDDAGIATGRLAGRAAFMGLRSQRVTRPQGGDFGGTPDVVSTTDLHPYRWAGDRAAATAIGQLLGDGIHTHYQPSDEPETIGRQWLLHPDSRSWATVDLAPEAPYEVCQAGPLRLFDKVEAAYELWLESGRPQLVDWTVTVGPAGQTIALDSEAKPVSASR
jgi:protein-L-isoaspartate(D-aspartate) O-methyltransferase